MSKYLLFILIGIILYILSNNKDGFNIGIPEYAIVSDTLTPMGDDQIMTDPANEIIVDESEQEPTYYVWADNENDARRKLKRYINLNTDGTTLVNINLTTPVINVDQNDDTNVTCKPNYRCTIGDKSFQVDTTKEDCIFAFDEELDIYNCRKYHTITNCIQNCTFANENDNLEKTLEKDGFQKISNLVDVSYQVTDSMEMVEESMEPNFKTFYTTFKNITEELDVYSDNGFLYSEYVFQMFLENIYPGSKLHKLTDGLYFINGKFIICRIAKGNLRISNIRTTIWDDLTPEQQGSATTLGWNKFFWNRQFDDDSLFVKTPNWENLSLEQQDAATTLGWTLETWGKDVPYSKFYNTRSSPFPLLHMDFQKYITNDNIGNIYTNNTNEWLKSIDGKTSKYHYVNQYNYGIQFNSNENSKSINLWLLLQGSVGVKTMGFIDIIDDDDDNDSDKYDADTLRDMQANDYAIQKDDSNEYSMVPFPGRLTPYFQKNSVQFPNVLNIQTMDTTNINPNILYTYDMTRGDVLAFRTDIPHIGFKDNRTSIEFRYDYFEIDLPVSDYVEIDTDDEDFECAASTETIKKKHTYTSRPSIRAVFRYFNIDNIVGRDLVIDVIETFFDIIYNIFQDEYVKKFNRETPDELFYRFLEFLNSVPTLNLATNNPDRQGSLDRLNQYIVEFINSL